MSRFDFVTDAASAAYCEEIVDVMKRRFRISDDVALECMNRAWRGQTIVGLDLIYHEPPVSWAYDLYFGNMRAAEEMRKYRRENGGRDEEFDKYDS